MTLPTPLRRPAFRSVWSAGLVSDSGDWLLLVALPLVVYNLTGSAFGTSVAMLVELLPGILLAPVAGWFVDRFDRRRVLIVVSLAQGGCLSPLLFVHSQADLPIVYAVIAVEAALLAFFDPAKNALLPSLVETADLVAANSLIGFGQNISRLVGGPVGGVLLAVGGLRLIVVVDLITYVIAATLIARVAPEPPLVATVRSAEVDGASSYRSILGKSQVRMALAVTFIAQIAQGIFAVLFILFVVQRLHGGDSEVGLYRGVQAVGAVVGALALTSLARRWAPSALIAPSVIVFGLLDLTLWNLPSIDTAMPIYLVLFVVVGAPGLVLVTGVVSSLQQASDPRERGRVFGAFGLAGNAGQLIGIVVAGLLTEPLGLMVLLDTQAAIYLVAGIPALYERRRLRSGPSRPTTGQAGNRWSSKASSPTPNTAT